MNNRNTINQDNSQFQGIWDAKKLIEKICHYKALLPDNDRAYFFFDDDEPNNDERPSKRITRQRIKAVLSAYGQLVMDLSSSLSFIVSENCNEEKLTELESLLKEEFTKELLPYYDIREIIQEQYKRGIIFQMLMDYRRALIKIKYHWAGVMECNDAGCVTITTTKNMFRQSFKEMDEKLERMMVLLLGDDYDQTFSEIELIQNYGFPAISDKELQEMDIKWEVD